MKTINLHIGELVIDGLGNLSGASLGVAVEQELQTLFIRQGLHGLLAQSVSIESINSKPIARASKGNERCLGVQIANSVYQGMNR